MITKKPSAYDVSHWKEILDFKLVSPLPDVFITKATEGISLIDNKFHRFFSGMMDIPVIRGCFHFHRKANNPYQQAEHFIKVISQMDILPTDLLILDVEEGGERASQLWAWFKTVHEAYWKNPLLLYGRKNQLDLIYMTVGEKEFFKKIWTWPAGYPYFPDLFSAVPSGYIPDQTKYGKPALWQYSKSGVVSGIQGAVDMNLILPEFYATLGSNVGVTTMASFTGTCINVDNKVWDRVGGRVIGSVRNGASISGDTETVVAGVAYLHLNSPMSGWTKKQWFTITYITEPPPPPPDPEPTVVKTHTIDFYNNGKISVDGSQPF